MDEPVVLLTDLPLDALHAVGRALLCDWRHRCYVRALTTMCAVKTLAMLCRTTRDAVLSDEVLWARLIVHRFSHWKQQADSIVACIANNNPDRRLNPDAHPESHRRRCQRL